MKYYTILFLSMLFLSACKKEDTTALTKNAADYPFFVANDTMYLVNKSSEQIKFYSISAEREFNNQLCRVAIPQDSVFYLSPADTFKAASNKFKSEYPCSYPFALDSNVQQITLYIFDHYYLGDKELSLILKLNP